jgi:hypothetical protein
MMSNNVNKDVITRFITEIWNGNHLDALDAFLDPAYYDYTYEPRNRQGLERALLLMQSAFPGHETMIEEIVEEGDTGLSVVFYPWDTTSALDAHYRPCAQARGKDILPLHAVRPHPALQAM